MRDKRAGGTGRCYEMVERRRTREQGRQARRSESDLHEGENKSVSGGSWAAMGYERGLW